jgi:hypothetical protein
MRSKESRFEGVEDLPPIEAMERRGGGQILSSPDVKPPTSPRLPQPPPPAKTESPTD